mgnify:FL=1|jgi:hypothetical protein|tara:strand:- start:10708 stop:10938 length:231 start_codon:yes stop_codon:yes gene_type:complete
MDLKGLTTETGMMGGVMFLLGIHQFGWLKENIGEFDLFGKIPLLKDIPVINDLTPLKILGVGGIYYGGKMLYDCCA